MNDTSRRYRAINQGLMQSYQPRPTGHREQHLHPLVALIRGPAGGRHAHLPTIAGHAPSNGATRESVITRFRRSLQHEAQPLDGWSLPVAQALLGTLAQRPIQLVMDGSVVGRGCAWPCWWVSSTAAAPCRWAGSSSPHPRATSPRRPIGRCWPRGIS